MRAPPFLIAHGTLDETVPFDQASRLHHALTAQGYLEFAYLALRFFERTL